MHGRRRFVLVVLLAGVVLLPVLLLGHIRFYSHQSRLPESGRERVRIRGLRDQVTIALDGRGVPHIDAAAGEDLWFAQGYVHARDRFFQMDLGRRMAAGRLSEVFGEDALPTDRKMRTLRLAATAARQAGALDDGARKTLERYSDGVNAALRAHGRWIAPELWMLGAEPAAWGVEDCLSVGLLLQLNLTWAMGDEITRSVEMTHLGREHAAGLWGWGSDEQRRWIPPVDLPSRPPGEEDAILPPFGGGSNNWAIGPARTATGRPLLANDPHIGVAVPGTWFAVGLRAPGIRAVGASIAGIPGVLIGHNSRVAWGFTMSMMDDQDFFVLTLDESRDRELVDDNWIPLRTVTETIEVRWRSEPETMKVRISRHGPVVRDTFDSTLALAWTALQGPSAVDAFLRMVRADGVEDVAAAWSDAAGPSMNLVAADVEGHILHQVVGRRPRRGRGAGRLPSPGSDSAWSWKGLAE
ncbi:MAG: penicillin acylase family protein, partial [Acidobacteriota bacterium]